MSPASVTALAEKSFAVRAVLRPVDNEDRSELRCGDFDFTARFARDGSRWVLVAAVAGEQARTVLEPRGTEYRATVSDPARPPRYEAGPRVLDFPAGTCCERLLLDNLRIVPAADETGALVGFSATGNGELTSETCGGDTYNWVPFDVTLTAVTDIVPPQVVWPKEPLNPFDPIEFRFDEIASADTTATLVDEQGQSRPLNRIGAPDPDGPFWGFSAKPLLAFGRGPSLLLAGADLAGNPFQLTGRAVLAAEDPGLLPQDGFESQINAIPAAVRVVTDRPISGEHSLLVGPARTTFHLRVAEEGAHLLRFDARNVHWDYGDDYVATVHVSAAFSGGTSVASLELPLDTPSIPDNPPPELPPVHALELGVPGSGRDVIVTFEMGPDYPGCGLESCDYIDAVIDNLRVE
jgi:hypothetical protein